MDFLIKLETKLNQLLLKLIALIKKGLHFLYMLIPAPVRELLGHCQEVASKQKEKLKTSSSQIKTNLKSFPQKAVKLTQEVKGLSQSTIKGISAGIEKARTLQKERKEQGKGSIFSSIAGVWSNFWDGVFLALSKVKQTTVVFTLITFAIGTIAGVNIFSSSKKIYYRSRPERAPASEDPSLKPRRKYHKLERRRFVLLNVNIPVYTTDTNRYQNLAVDLDIYTTNRLIRVFLFKNHNMVRDRINMTLQPIVPDFPLTPEGRTILTEKIKQELDVLIREQGLEGEIERIIITNIFTA